MRKTTLLMVLILVTFMSSPSMARNLIIYPKCAAFDTLHNRFLVICLFVGNIVAVDEDGQQSMFKSGLGEIVSNLIVGDLLYVSYDNDTEKGIYGINLHTGIVEKNIIIAEARLLGGLASDTSGHLYVVDDNFTNGRLYRIDLSDDSYTLYCSGLSARPQDVQFDAENNRLIVVGYSAAALIQAVSIPDHVISYIATTPCGPIDGIARDRDSNYYISCYEARKIYRYDKNFANQTELLTNLPGFPSNIDINVKNNVISIPYIHAHKMGYAGIDVDFDADTTWSWDSLAVDFQGSTLIGVDNWRWHFGDGDTAVGQAVQHTFRNPGAYDVTLYGDQSDTTFHLTRKSFISILADTIKAQDASGFPGQAVEVVINATNNAPLEMLTIPVDYSGALDLALDSISTVGCRTGYFDSNKMNIIDLNNHLAEIILTYSSNIAERLQPGAGPVAKLYFTIPSSAPLGTSSIKMSGFPDHLPNFSGSGFSYQPRSLDANVTVAGKCGDANGSLIVNIQDITFLINFLYKGGPAPNPPGVADVNGSGIINIQDITYLISFLYKGGPAPKCA